MVEEIYREDVRVEHAGRGPRGIVNGRAALRDAERQLLEHIPDHRNEIVRVVANGPAAVVECLLVGTTPGDPGVQCCPACVWWLVDENGLVYDEVAFYEWGKRRPYEAAARGTIRSGDGRWRSRDWYGGLAQRLSTLWETDPVAMVDTLYAEDTVVERLGEGAGGVVRGGADLEAAERELMELLPPGSRRMEVEAVVPAADVVAIRFTITGSWRGTGPLRSGPGCLLLTLAEDDRIISDRIYWHWSAARPLER